MRSLFERAAQPERLVVGLCSQYDEHEDAECHDLSSLPPEWASRVRSITMPWREARGPVWARAKIQRELFRGEDFFLQIDSHTRLAPRWDESLIAMLGRCGSPKPVLTTYPLPYEGEGRDATPSTEQHLTLLCTRPAADAFGQAEAQPAAEAAAETEAEDLRMLRFRARLLARPPASPCPTCFWAAGFSFSSGELVTEVPYDPHLPFLFFGEEISIAVRAWTRGWDLFAPDAHVAYHLWARTHRATFWELEGGAALKRRSQARVRRLLTGRPLAVEPTAPAPAEPLADAVALLSLAGGGGGGGEMAPVAAGPTDHSAEPLAEPGLEPRGPSHPVWGLGTARSLASYEQLSGVDFHTMQVSARAERGGVPAEEALWDRFACLEAAMLQ